jgi:spore germination protein KC
MPTSGCGKQELNEMAIVMAVGLDKAKDGSIVVTAQIARPADARGSTGAPSGGTGEPIWTISSKGKSIFEAIRNLGRFSSRRVFWAHNKVIVIGADLARDSITDTLDFFTRNHELRMNTWIVVTPGKASEIVSLKTGLEVIPGDSIDRLFRFNQIVSEAPRTTIKEVSAAYLSHTSHPVMAIVKKAKRLHATDEPSEFGSEEQVELSGTAVFDKERMIGSLSPSESRALLMFIERIDSGVIAMTCPDHPKLPISLEIKRSGMKITPSYHGDRVAFNMAVNIQMDLVEIGCPITMSVAEVASEMEEEASLRIKKDIEKMLNKSQKKFKTDFLDLGKTFQNRYPNEWQSLEKDWPDVFRKADMQVDVTVEINNPVLKILPTRPFD